MRLTRRYNETAEKYNDEIAAPFTRKRKALLDKIFLDVGMKA